MITYNYIISSQKKMNEHLQLSEREISESRDLTTDKPMTQAVT